MTLNRTDSLEDSLDLACNGVSESSSSSSQRPGEETETVYETAARLLFMSVRWTKNLASFSALAQSDQAALLEESWAQLFERHVANHRLPRVVWLQRIPSCEFVPGDDQPPRRLW